MARLTGVFRRLYQLARPFPMAEQTAVKRGRGPLKLVIILDGTMSSLEPGEETNAGLAYRLLSEVPGVAIYYEAGLQWQDWRATRDVMLGRGINRQIRRAYGWLASRYHPGDQVYLVGYSRGAFAVRSLAGVIDRVGLLRAEEATERNIQTAYRHYQAGEEGEVQEALAKAYCHERVEIDGIFLFGKRSRLWGFESLCSGDGWQKCMRSMIMRLGRQSDAGFKPWRPMKLAWLLSRCCGAQMKKPKPVLNSFGFREPIAISAAS